MRMRGGDQMTMTLGKNFIRGLVCLLACAALLGCEKPAHPNDQSLSYWADPKNEPGDPCVAATAQAILKSGLPYPHFQGEEITKPDGTKEMRAKTVDVWVGPTRFVLPAKLVRDNGAYARNHPRRFWQLGGSLPHFYPVGEPGPVVDGMGSMVDISIVCSVEPDYVASWRQEGYLSNADGIEKAKTRYETELHRGYKGKPQAKVTVNRRDDLGMMEILFERGGVYNDGQPMWEASYWPLNAELKGPTGSVSGIGCKTRHDPEKRYGKVGWRCGAGMRLTPEAGVSIEIYVSQIQHMPVVYEQVKQLFINAQQN